MATSGAGVGRFRTFHAAPASRLLLIGFSSISRTINESAYPLPNASADLNRNGIAYDYVIERLRAYYVEGGAGIAVTAEMFDADTETEKGRAAFRRFLRDLGYDYVDESRNPAYRFFLR